MNENPTFLTLKNLRPKTNHKLEAESAKINTLGFTVFPFMLWWDELSLLKNALDKPFVRTFRAKNKERCNNCNEDCNNDCYWHILSSDYNQLFLTKKLLLLDLYLKTFLKKPIITVNSKFNLFICQRSNLMPQKLKFTSHTWATAIARPSLHIYMNVAFRNRVFNEFFNCIRYCNPIFRWNFIALACKTIGANKAMLNTSRGPDSKVFLNIKRPNSWQQSCPVILNCLDLKLWTICECSDLWPCTTDSKNILNRPKVILRLDDKDGRFNIFRNFISWVALHRILKLSFAFRHWQVNFSIHQLEKIRNIFN